MPSTITQSEADLLTHSFRIIEYLSLIETDEEILKGNMQNMLRVHAFLAKRSHLS